MSMPTGCLGPYSASSVRPATIVGSANGRSISAFTARLPRKSSRTSTQAISVPVTALITTTIAEVMNVSLSAASACGPVTTSTKPESPSSSDVTATAASGSSTMMLRYVSATPRPSAAPPRSGTARGRGVLLGDGRGPAVSSLGGGDTKVLLDAGHDALVLVEELVGHRVPASELLDREELLGRGELVRARRALHHRPVALRREDPLRLGRVQVLHERLRLVARVLGRGDRVLDQDRLVRDRVVDVLACLLRRDRLVLVRNQHVALAAGEGREGVARALVLHRDVLEQRLQVVDGLGLRLALLELGAVRGHDVPACAAARERVRRDHLDARLREVVPGLDVLGVALAGDEDDHGVRDHALVLVLVPALVDEAAVDEPRHVRLERELDHVGGQATVDRTALVAGRAVGLAEADALAVGRLVERRDQRPVGLLRRRVGDEVDLVAAARAAAAGAAAAGHGGGYGRGERGDGYEPHEHGLLHVVRRSPFSIGLL